MITVKTIPLATATEQELLVEITEKVCNTFCVGGILPTASVTFQVVDTKVLGGNTIGIILATITIVSPSQNGCGCANTQVYGETFEVPFNSSGTNVISIVQGSGTLVEPYNVKCCKANSIKLTTSLTASID